MTGPAADPRLPDEEPPPLAPHLEEGIEWAQDWVAGMLRSAGDDVAEAGDADLLKQAAACEAMCQEWPPDVGASILIHLYRAEVLHRMDESDRTDRRQRFTRMARRAGYRRAGGADD